MTCTEMITVLFALVAVAAAWAFAGMRRPPPDGPADWLELNEPTN